MTRILTAVLTLVPLLLLAESPGERELTQLKRDQSKAVAAAVAPLNARYATSLEQLLKKATQAKDLDLALKVREELETLGVTSHGSGNAKLKITAETLPQYLAKGEWTWADSEVSAKNNSTHVTFARDGEMIMSGKSQGPFKVVNASTLEVMGGTLKFTDDYERFEFSKSGHNRFGERVR